MKRTMLILLTAFIACMCGISGCKGGGGGSEPESCLSYQAGDGTGTSAGGDIAGAGDAAEDDGGVWVLAGIESVTQGKTVTITYDYDSDRNRTREACSSEGTSWTRTNTYDQAGRVTGSVMDYQYTYDRTVSRTRTTTRNTYDVNGDLVRSTDTTLANGDTWVSTQEMAYDSRHNVIWTKYTNDLSEPVITTCSYTYSTRGDITRMTSSTDGVPSSSTEYVYDASGKKMQADYFYYLEGKKIHYDTIRYTYDSQGRMTSDRMTVFLSDGSTQTYTHSYAYDANGNTETVRTIESGDVTTYTWILI